MATLAEIKDHINSVSSIAKVTNALQVMSAAQHQRLRARLQASGAYAELSWAVLTRLASAASDALGDDPVFTGRAPVRAVALLVIAGDRGMAGDYYQALSTEVRRFVQSQEAPVRLLVVGSHGGQALGRWPNRESVNLQLTTNIQVDDLSVLARALLDAYRAQQYDAIHVAYTRYLGGVRFSPSVEQWLPLQLDLETPRQVIFEPAPEQLLAELLPAVLRYRLFSRTVESMAAETAARMMAMRTATRNAQDLIGRLRTSYNKARQQTITNEMLDIIGGADAVQHAGGPQ